MKEQYLKEIHEACVKANPKIVDLNFGCEVEFFQRKITFVSLKTLKNGKHLFTYVSPDEKLFSNYYLTNEINSIIILGRPLQLADVLLAIGYKEKFYFKEPSSVHVDHLMLCLINPLGHIHWNLKETLENQSEECLEFIHSLIK